MRKSTVEKRILFIVLSVFFFSIPLSYNPCHAADNERIQQELEALQLQVQELKEELEKDKLQQPEQAQGEAPSQGVEEAAGADGVDIGGAVRFSYAYRDFSDASEDKGGDIEFDIFRLDVNGQYDNVLVSAQYRWYSYMDVIHHGWVGYNFNNHLQGQFGVTQVPFGLLPYASHNWWFGIPYYVGLEDDYDMGIKAIWDRNDWNFQLAFFKNGEWGNASKLERYSYDIVSDNQANEETNQFNGRLAYVYDHGNFGKSEVGISGQLGQIYNTTESDSGEMWAAAIHLNGNYGPFNLLLEAITYSYDPENPAGVSDDTIEMGAFGVSSLVASEAEIYVAGLSYDLPVSWGPVSKLTFYNDYSVMVKDGGFPDSYINTTGCLITAGPLYVYVDYILGKNAQFLGGGTNPFGDASDSNDDWNTRFNVNFGYYF